jgi:hypothetical protein
VRPVRTIGAVVLALLGAATVSALSRVPRSLAGDEDALLRLSWRISGVRVQECRPRTQAELDALAPHMRTPEVCTGGNAAYLLAVEVDGREVVRDTVLPAGARGDRPVSVLRDIPLAPGRYRVEVELQALLPDGFDAGEQTLEHEYEGDVTLGPAEIALVTLDGSRTRLVLRTP